MGFLALRYLTQIRQIGIMALYLREEFIPKLQGIYGNEAARFIGWEAYLRGQRIREGGLINFVSAVFGDFGVFILPGFACWLVGAYKLFSRGNFKCLESVLGIVAFIFCILIWGTAVWLGWRSKKTYTG